MTALFMFIPLSLSLSLPDSANLQPRGAVLPDLSVPSCGSSHHSLWPHLLLALHAALPVSERENLVQVSHLLRGRAQRRPQEVASVLLTDECYRRKQGRHRGGAENPQCTQIG